MVVMAGEVYIVIPLQTMIKWSILLALCLTVILLINVTHGGEI